VRGHIVGYNLMICRCFSHIFAKFLSNTFKLDGNNYISVLYKCSRGGVELGQPAQFPRVWEILKRFIEFCHRKGWKTSDYEDIVKIDEEYHNLIGTRTIHPSTFGKITSSKKRAIPEGKSYRTIDVSYTAWVFQQQPSDELVQAVSESGFSKRTALYDLSGLYQGKPFYLRLNETDSPVFDEFEKFLKKTYGVETKQLYEPRTNEPKTFKSKLLRASIG
jgi:hypothetical protein